MKVQDLFELGMKRELPDLLAFDGPEFDIGSSGKHKVEGAISLGYPDWFWPIDKIPAANSTVATIHCYHFLEHLSGVDAIAFLREAERVMIPGASVLNFVVPYFSSPLQAQDLTHKSVWCEDTFKTLFNNPYYDPAGKWKLALHFQMIAGIVNRNLALMGQIVRVK